MKYEINEKVYAINNGKLCNAIYLSSRRETTPIGPQITIITVLIPEKDSPGLEVELEDRFVFHSANWMNINAIRVYLNKLLNLLSMIKSFSKENHIPLAEGQRISATRVSSIINQIDRIEKSFEASYKKTYAFCNSVGKPFPLEVSDAMTQYNALKEEIHETLINILYGFNEPVDAYTVNSAA